MIQKNQVYAIYLLNHSDVDQESVTNIKTKENPKKMNPKEIVFLDEEKDRSSSSTDEEQSGVPIVNLVESKVDSSDESSVEIEESPENSIVEIEENSDSVNPEDDHEFDLDEAANYFNRQNGEMRCRRCGNTGHMAADCPFSQNQDPCIQCASVTHQVKSCPTNICRQSLSLLSIIPSCYQQGHSTRDCPHTHLPPQCIHCSSRLHSPEVLSPSCEHIELSHDASSL